MLEAQAGLHQNQKQLLGWHWLKKASWTPQICPWRHITVASTYGDLNSLSTLPLGIKYDGEDFVRKV